jgi:hypothetical protein
MGPRDVASLSERGEEFAIWMLEALISKIREAG